jgi:hypothetical protein
MNHHDTSSMSTLFGNPTVAQKGSFDQRTKNSPIVKKESFVNNLPVPVTVCWRNGMKFSLPPEPSVDNNTLIIRISISVRPAAYQSVLRMLSQVRETSSPELRAIQQSFQAGIRINTYKGGEIVLDYAVTMEQLEEYGGTIYFSEIDSVVSLQHDTAELYHPFSEEGRRQQVIADVPLNDGSQNFCYSVVMVDNSGNYGTRYLTVMCTRYLLPATS